MRLQWPPQTCLLTCKVGMIRVFISVRFCKDSVTSITGGTKHSSWQMMILKLIHLFKIILLTGLWNEASSQIPLPGIQYHGPVSSQTGQLCCRKYFHWKARLHTPVLGSPLTHFCSVLGGRKPKAHELRFEFVSRAKTLVGKTKMRLTRNCTCMQLGLLSFKRGEGETRSGLQGIIQGNSYFVWWEMCWPRTEGVHKARL